MAYLTVFGWYFIHRIFARRCRTKLAESIETIAKIHMHCVWMYSQHLIWYTWKILTATVFAASHKFTYGHAINFHFASFHFLAVYFAGIVLFHIRLVTTASPLILSLWWCCARSFPHRSAPHPLVCDRVVARFTCRRNKTKVSFSLPLINLCECMLLPFVYYLDALQCLSWQFFFERARDRINALFS